MSLSKSYIRKLDYVKWFVIAFWLVLLGLGPYSIKVFLDHVDLSFSAPPGTRAFTAKSKLEDSFGRVAGPSGQPLLVLIERIDPTNHSRLDVLVPATKNFSLSLKNYLVNYSRELVGPVSVEGYYTVSTGTSQIDQQLEKRFVNDGHNATLLLIDYDTSSLANDVMNDLRTNITKDIQSFLQLANDGSGDLYTRLTGFSVFAGDIVSGVQSNMENTEKIAFPFAIIILALVVRNFRLLFIPIVCIGAVAMTSFAVMIPIAYNFSVASFAPSLMLSVSLALSIDYSLFLLSRFREEILINKRDYYEAIEEMVAHAGHTIVVSGVTITTCFFSLLFFPLAMIRSMGIAAAITVIAAMTVNLSLTPAILLIGGDILANFKCFGLTCESIEDQRKAEEENEGDNNSYARLSNGLGGPGHELPHWSQSKSLTNNVHMEHREESDPNSCWAILARLIRRFSLVFILVLFGCGIPLGLQIPKLSLRHSFDLAAPRDALATETFNDLLDSFGASSIIQSSILIVAKDPSTTVLSSEAFNENFEFIKQLSKKGPKNTTYNGIFYQCDIAQQLFFQDDCHLTYEQYSNIIGPDDPIKSLRSLAQQLNDQLVNGSNTSQLVQIETPKGMDPFSENGGQWIIDVRNALDELQADGVSPPLNFSYYLVQGDTEGHDSVEAIKRLFPILVAGLLGTVSILIAVSFQSILIPIRSVLTMGLTCVICYAMAILVYQESLFQSLNLACLMTIPESPGFYWIGPVFAFPVVIGLSLDYDVFILTRIHEYKCKGYSDVEAIHHGLVKTGNIITAAGLIMIIAFSGLLLTTEALLYQMAFLLIIAVFVDTFVVRTMLVPAIMFALAPHNFWPGIKNDHID